MAHVSFQKEKPPARINLFLEVLTDGAQRKKELPLRMLMLGDYSGGANPQPVEDREAILVTREHFDEVMQAVQPTAHFAVDHPLRADGATLPVTLRFDGLDAFHPEQVARQIPTLSRLLAMRRLLQDLRHRLISASDFRRQLEAIVHDPDARQRLVALLDTRVAPPEPPESR